MKSLTIDFGIDLGTTNSTIARLNGIDTEVFKNNEGFEFTPSAVWIDEKNTLRIGRRAKDKLVSDPQNAFSEFKLQMGTETKYLFQRSQRSLSPQDLSAEVLKSLKNDIKRQLGIDMTSVVITVPAAFELPQCKATSEAAELAGFTYHPLLQEPIAAAMAYGFQSESNNKFWMVYDFGGGTFDAAIVKIKDGLIEVVHHGGDNGLGGKNIDWAIVNELLIPAVEEQFHLSNLTRENKKYLGLFAKLKSAAEDAKIRLSVEDTAEIQIENLFKNDQGEQVDFTCELLRSDFERLAKPFIIQSINICKKVLQEKRLGTSNIEKMIMVGGTSMIPYLRKMLLDTNEGLGVPLESSIYPITVVAKGAAVFAASQRMPDDHKINVNKDEFFLELEYQPVGTDEEPTIAGRVVTDTGLDFNGYTIEFVNRTAKPQWRSGKFGLTQDGGFYGQLWTERSKKNEFTIELFDSFGTLQKTAPGEFSYTWGIVSAEPPLIHSLGVAMANNETDFLLKKGTPLPAKNSTVHRNVHELKAGGDGFLKIPIIEGENQRHADHNREIGAIIIHANKIRRTVPANSEIEIKLSMDTSRLVIAKAYVPILDEEYEAEVDLRIEPGKISDMRKSFEEDKTKYQKLVEKAKSESDPKALDIIEEIASENIIAEIESLLEAAKGDADSNLKAKNRILDFKTKLDNIEDILEWPMLVSSAQEILNQTKDVVNIYGKPEDKRRLETLKNELEAATKEKDPDLLRRRSDQIDGLYWFILKEQPEFWIGCFNYAKEDVDEIKDRAEADLAIRKGNIAIQNNDNEGLKAAVRRLWELFPALEAKSGGLFNGGTQV